MAKAKNKQKLVLLDAHAILHRAYHALPDFVSSKGEPTGGLYGVITMLLRIIADLKPDYLVACYDRADATFRKQIYEGYKSGRAKAEDALVAQMQSSREVFAALGIPIYDHPGFEADDIIGTIVEQTKREKDLEVVIASGDMDTMQLVSGTRVTVYTLKRGLNDTILYDEAAVQARFGFGPALLPDFKGLAGDPSDNIIGIAGIGEKTATALITHFGTIENIYKTLKKDREALARAGIRERVMKLLEEGEEEALFSKTLATIRRDAPITFSLENLKSWRESLDIKQAEALFARFEFRTLAERLRRVVGASEASPDSYDPKLLRELSVAAWLLNSELINAGPAEILQVAHTATLEQAKPVLLEKLKQDNLLKVYTDIELPLIPIIDAAEQHGVLVDVGYLKKLSDEYHAQLAELEQKIYKLAGGEFNLNSPKQLGEVLFDKLGLAVKGVRLKKTAGGVRSTRESELLKLKDTHPVIAEILSYRELQKLVSTYLDTIPTQVDATGRLHTHLNQAGAATGRMSSSSPNLQNIPNTGEHAPRVRRAFIAAPGHVWLACDYSQIEMRVLALLSGDENLRRVFTAGEDVHTAVAARVFRVAESEVAKEQRRQAKVINFGIIYGMGVNALRQNLGGSREAAQEFYDSYFIAFPQIHAYLEKVKHEALVRGYTETYFGRRRYFPGLKSKLPFVKAMNERMAMNAPLQGTAADIVKIAIKKVDDALKQANLLGKAHLLLQVHDELIYEVEEGAVASVLKIIKPAMETELNSVRFTVGASVGENWAELK